MNLNEMVGKVEKKRLRKILEREDRNAEGHNGQEYYIMEDAEDISYVTELYSKARNKEVASKRYLCLPSKVNGKARLYRETTLGGLKVIYVDQGRGADKLRLEACFREPILEQWEELRQRVKCRTGTMEYVGTSFVTLTKMFLKEKNLKSKDIILTGEGPTLRFKNSTLAMDWAEYHNENAEIVYKVPECEGLVECEESSNESDEISDGYDESVEEYNVNLDTREGLKSASLYLDKVLRKQNRKVLWKSGRKREEIEGIKECAFLFEVYKKSRKRFGDETPMAPKGYFLAVYKGMRSVYFEMWNGYSSVMGARAMVIKEPTHHRKVQLCFREAVMEQVQLFKAITFASNKQVYCALTGEKLERGMCHVDHFEPEFIDLTRDFLKERKLSETELETQGYGPQLSFRDEEFRDEWARYHENKAKLRLTTAEANFGREKSKRKQQAKIGRDRRNGERPRKECDMEQRAQAARECLRRKYGERFEQEWRKFAT